MPSINQCCKTIAICTLVPATTSRWRIFVTRLVISEEAHFHFNGYVNKQHCRFWHPLIHAIVTKSLYTVYMWRFGVESHTVHGIVGPCVFFEGENENMVTVNAECYKQILNGFLISKLNELNMQDLWFQQDRATWHTTRRCTELLWEHFPGKLISRFGDVNWPPRSDISPPEYLHHQRWVGVIFTALSVCLPVNRISQKVADRFGQNFVDRFGVWHGWNDSILVKIRIWIQT